MGAGIRFEFVEGATGDLSFVARGATLEAAFSGAGQAFLAATVEDPAEVRSSVTRHAALSASTPDLLLLRFLNELIYLRDAEGLLLRAHRIRTTQDADGARLEAELVGEPWSRERHVPANEVKAATAHGLTLQRVDGGWEARATLDV